MLTVGALVGDDGRESGRVGDCGGILVTNCDMVVDGFGRCF